MAKSPKKLNIRTYHVGFGDCFLLSFEYGSTTKNTSSSISVRPGCPTERPRRG